MSITFSLKVLPFQYIFLLLLCCFSSFYRQNIVTSGALRLGALSGVIGRACEIGAIEVLEFNRFQVRLFFFFTSFFYFKWHSYHLYCVLTVKCVNVRAHFYIRDFLACHSTPWMQCVAMGTMTSVTPCDFILRSPEKKKKKDTLLRVVCGLSSREWFVGLQCGGGRAAFIMLFFSHICLKVFREKWTRKFRLAQKEGGAVHFTRSSTYPSETLFLLMAYTLYALSRKTSTQNALQMDWELGNCASDNGFTKCFFQVKR